MKDKHQLIEEDEVLFNEMIRNSKSENERIFFVTMKNKEEHVLTISNDLILSEHDNDDHLYMVRLGYEEYLVGKSEDSKEFHAMTLKEALDLNLKAHGWINEDITLLQWLQKHDYNGVQYNHNFDDL